MSKFGPGNEFPQIVDTPPEGEAVTEYDSLKSAIYRRVLEAHRAGADWQVVSRVLLQIDPGQEPQRARRRYENHLARAQWMMEHRSDPLIRAP